MLNNFTELSLGGTLYGNPYASGTIGSQYDYIHDEEDSTFQLVDTSKPQKQNVQRGGRIRQQQLFYVRFSFLNFIMELLEVILLLVVYHSGFFRIQYLIKI